MAFGLMFAAGAAFGDSLDTFMSGISACVESITWSEESGFVLTLRGKKFLLLHNNRYTQIRNRKMLTLNQGEPYCLTNGRGRSREFTAIPLTNVNGRANGMLDAKQLLKIELRERINRAGEYEVIRFLLSSNGKLFDANTNLIREVAFPQTLKDEDHESGMAKGIEAIALENKVSADPVKAQALAFLEDLVKKRKFAHSETNSVYLSQETSEIERIAAMTKGGALSPTLASLLQGSSTVKERQYKRALFYVDKTGVHLVRVEEKFSAGNMKNYEFYDTGELAMFEDDLSAGRLRVTYYYDKSGELSRYVSSNEGVVDGLWQRRGNALIRIADPSSDTGMAMP